VLRLVGDNPQASRSQEAAEHLARCADCRRQARLALSGRSTLAGRAFGFFPPLFGLGRVATLFHPRALTPSIKRISDRARDAFALAGPGSSALAAPIVRMAEVAGGVLVATVVTMSPALTSTAQTTGTAVSSTSAAAAPAQVQSVASTSVLYQASPAAPVIAGSAPSLAQSSTAVTTPSLVGPSTTPDAGPPDLLAQLGLSTGGNVVDNTLSNVGSVSNILADQLDQVARLTNSTLDQVTSPLGPQFHGLIAPVNELTNGVTKGLGGTLKNLVNGLRSTVPSSVAPNSVVTASVVPNSAGPSSAGPNPAAAPSPAPTGKP
jgi:hypothetical protein